MKKLILFACVALFALSCNDKGSSTDNKSGDSTKTADKSAKLDYPYTLDKPYQDWQAGDQQHAITVMKALKGFETGDIPACVAQFGDSVDVLFDNYRGKMSHDSLTKFFTTQRAAYKSMTVKMEDWESVIGKDKDEWVTLWYKQTWVDTKGKADSLAIIDDAKMVKGKIVVLDEKIQHYPAKK